MTQHPGRLSPWEAPAEDLRHLLSGILTIKHQQRLHPYPPAACCVITHLLALR